MSALCLAVSALAVGAAPPISVDAGGVIRMENTHVRWLVGPDGINRGFVGKRSGRDLLRKAPPSAFAVARKGTQAWGPTSARISDGGLRLAFPGGREALLSVAVRDDSLTFTVARWSGDADELTFAMADLAVDAAAPGPFAACSLALNLRTNVDPIPGPSTTLGAHSYARLGIDGASCAVVAGPTSGLRDLLKRAVSAAPGLPKSAIGGPWALDSPTNRASYVFNFGGLGPAEADKWIAAARSVGATQIDFHGGDSFRFGDFVPNPKTYPKGRADFKAVIDKLHAAGMQAGLHTYAFFIDKRSPYVTPVPDKRLASARTMTLAAPLDDKATEVVVNESTQGMNATTGFFVTNSTTLRVGDELISFTGASQSPPWRFTGCTRGALGTKAAAHAAGTKADHLKELFGLFLPDGDSTLFVEIADNTARMYNECGFDMLYLDALDGSYILAGGEWAWHYGSTFVFELWKRLKRPAIMEMSTFHHHLWYVRSRMGAWDCPHTGFKEFVDMHRVVNRANERMYLSSQLGWWAVTPWEGIQPDRMLPDDLEYLMSKALADDAGLSMQSFNPDALAKGEGLRRHAAMIRRYEELRRTQAVPARIRKQLAEPRAEFTLIDGKRGQRAFAPVRYVKQTVDGNAASWRLDNPYDAQPARMRVEANLGIGPNTQPNRLLSAASLGVLTAPRCAPGVTLAVDTAAGPAAEGAVRLKAHSSMATRTGAWCMVERLFDPAIDLNKRGLGVWVCGDGKGAVLNLQLRSPENVTPGAAEHYITLDFTGWRYVELVEPECERLSTLSWPYAVDRATWEKNAGQAFGAAYKLYHPWVVYGAIGALGVWLNNLPAGGDTEVVIGSVEALPLAPCTISRPTVSIGGTSVTFPVDLKSGQYLEYEPGGASTVYGPAGEKVADVKPEGGRPALAAGANEVTFACAKTEGPKPRCRVTIMPRGAPVRF